jgi:hypothetical protein
MNTSLTIPLEQSILNIETIPKEALQTVTSKLPELVKKTSAFNRSNSQSTLNMMTLTMLNGQSPHRVVRQILAEIEHRYIALAESQVSHTKLINEVSDVTSDEVFVAEQRLKKFRIEHLENKIAGAIKDIAVLISSYERIVETHGIKDWTEEDFERAEVKHHIRRGFELLYRNMIEHGSPKESTIEYLQQFGVHVQLALYEVVGYITYIDNLIKGGERPGSLHLEQFLNEMSVKYVPHTIELNKYMFGVEDTVVPEFTNKW